ncbi:NlpC/P60 family protein [Clostridium sp. LP20]|uniref:C40 family peptidase n=1 Tax=Clostridium sp. LP20 TaxID=3418665 RepID=UPI003EE7CE86
MKKFKKIFSAALLFCMIGALIPSVQAKGVTTTQGQAIVDEAKKYLGSPYVWGGKGEYLTTNSLNELKKLYPAATAEGRYTTAEKYVNMGYRAFDCSGLTSYVYSKVLGINIGAGTYSQVNAGVAISRSELQPGDLVFPHADHVQIYIGNGQVIESPKSHEYVRVVNLGDVWKARRIEPGDIENPNKNGWTYEEGKSYYYNNGVKQKGWIYVNNHSYYLDSNDGHMLIGWQQVNGYWYYLNETYGHMLTGWIEINGNRYYLDPTYGHMRTGWNDVGGNKYYFNTTYGHAEKGWLQLGDKWYYMNENDGYMEKGWIYVNNNSYLLDSNDGYMLKGWQKVNDQWYYLNETYGHCELGWVYVNGQKYFTDPTYGNMWTGWQKIDGKWYYFNKIYGHAEINTIVDGYTLNADGIAIDKFD